MTHMINERVLLDIAGNCGSPAVRHGNRTLAGESDWRSTLSTELTVDERWALLEQLEPHLLESTPAARERMQEWQDRDRSADDAPPETVRQRLAKDLLLY